MGKAPVECCQIEIARVGAQDPRAALYPGDYRLRTQVVIAQSKLLLHQSDALLRWCETYGPRPYSSKLGI
jgi:hypothetical protein